MRRPRAVNKTPLAVAGILATPLFFVALMAFSLLLEKPSVEVKGGALVLGDPIGANNAAIYLSSFAVSALVVLLGVVALLLPSRVALFLPTLGAIVVTVALLLRLETWQSEHTARYPDGVDLIPKDDPTDLTLRGEWEQAAHQTANQIGFWTIVLAVVAITISIVVDVRRRRKIAPPPVLPPPEAITAESKVIRRGFGLPRRRSRGT
jgi:hypothetical protein